MPAALEVTDLTITIDGRPTVRGVTFRAEPSARVALLGRSGSGKSLTANAIVGSLTPRARCAGSIRIGGTEVLGCPSGRRAQQARAGLIAQDSAQALNPLVPVGRQLRQALRRNGAAGQSVTSMANDLLTAVGLVDTDRVSVSYPSELSGGQRQRVCIAVAVACRTSLLVADEATSALDVVNQAGVLRVLRERAVSDTANALLFITHDIAAAAALCEQVIVIEEGRVVESGAMAEVVAAPAHPVTRELVQAAIESQLPDRLPGSAAAVPA